MIETRHLHMRVAAEADFDALWEIWSDPRVQAGLLTRPQTMDEFAPVFALLLSTPTMWVIEDRASHLVIGRAGIFEFPEERTAEVAYLLHPDWWGRGLATEAATAALGYAFEARGWDRAIAFVLPTNIASISVLRKLGLSYVHDAEVRGQAAELYELQRASHRA